MTENELLQLGIGRKLDFLGHAADMVSISLSSQQDCPYAYAIHISAECELLYQGSMLTNTEDIFKYVRPNITRFDEKIRLLLDEGKEFFLKELTYDNSRCLHVKFSNSFEVHSLPETTNSDENSEMWRVFLNWKAEPHLIATQREIWLDPCKVTQEELDRVRMHFSAKRQKESDDQTIY